MRARLLKLWQDLQGSYYFIPGLMALGAILLAHATTRIDRSLDPSAIEDFTWFYTNSTDGAQVILSTIAGSMMTVAGVTFSLTVVAVTTAASQYGPRLIGNFMRDKANQFTLGTFTSTFVYCLLIMRVTRTSDEDSVNNAVEAIVPNVSLLVALGLTLASVGVLIYFIHHIPERLNVSNITARVGKRLRDVVSEGIAREVPSGEDSLDVLLAARNVDENWFAEANKEGYVQALDDSTFLQIATDNDLLLITRARPGDFIVSGQPLIEIVPREAAPDEAERKAIAQTLRDSYAVGQDRTQFQNELYLADELVEILARALSPGVNDPFTAKTCIHWFRAALTDAARFDIASTHKFDADENLRVHLPVIGFETLLDTLVGQSRPYVATDVIAAQSMDAMLDELQKACSTAEKRTAVKKQQKALHASAEQLLASKTDLAVFKAG